jgi:predicted nucleic acid-binding protein
VSAFLLDTNVISELLKPKPEPKVTTWIDATDEELLFLSVLTLGEIRKVSCSSPAVLAVLAWKPGSVKICSYVFPTGY